jgi:heterodisulfide reductase subunit B
MKYSYFPGCSLERNAAAYHQSTMAVAGALGIELVEIEDWNCCGATEYLALNRMAAYALIARNLAQAAKNEGLKQMVAPCSACYLNLSKTDHYLGESPALAAKVNLALAEGGLHYTPGSIQTRHPLDVIVNDVGYDAVAARVSKPLYGLRVAPYYGCLIVRPFRVFDDPEHPTSMDKLLRLLGAEVVHYPLKAQCCGGHMTQISEATGFDLIRQLVKCADDNGADLIVTLCPMCQLNLDAFQGAMNRHFKTGYYMPVLYFTQMMGLAFGIDAGALGIGAELVDARPALAKIGVEPPPKEPEKKRPKEALPMPGEGLR